MINYLIIILYNWFWSFTFRNLVDCFEKIYLMMLKCCHILHSLFHILSWFSLDNCFCPVVHVVLFCTNTEMLLPVFNSNFFRSRIFIDSTCWDSNHGISSRYFPEITEAEKQISSFRKVVLFTSFPKDIVADLSKVVASLLIC